MTRKEPHPEGLSRDESRFLDGELPPDAARRLESRLAADPQRAERLEAYREAMDVWREDAACASRAVDPPDALADRVVRKVTADPSPMLRPPGALPRWYAAAAVLLIAVGIGGTVLARRGAPRASDEGQQPELAVIEEAVLDLVLESPELSPRLTSLVEGR